MPLDYSFSPAEVCELFDISKSTLLRWEREGILPPPDRSTSKGRDTRVYTQRDLHIIAKRQEEESTKQYLRNDRLAEQRKRATGTRNVERLRELMQMDSLRKFLQGDEAGLAELAEYDNLQGSVLTRLLKLALYHCTPQDPTFSRITAVVYLHSCKLSGEPPLFSLKQWKVTNEHKGP